MAGSSKWRCGEWRGYGDEGIWGGGMGREMGGRKGWTRSDKMVVVLSQCCSNAASVV